MNPVPFFVSPTTGAVMIVGIVIAAFYLRYMWRALSKASRDRYLADDGIDDRYGHSLLGALIALGASIFLVCAYGFAPVFLYLGPLACLLSPVAIIYCFSEELKD
ncbi:hypothetical protein LJR034_001501 [Caballeronia sp. LjRoot34]|uniref:hypothetical protein n=1 Tax=Caballeronia sp. LjRoot34 TaxID=3342325 RepID=UPI003ECFC95C